MLSVSSFVFAGHLLRVVGFVLLLFLLPIGRGHAQVVINEVMYHPVEEAAFTNFHPVMDLSEDVHEFVELHNPTSELVNLALWKLSGDISYTFPSNTVIHAGQYLVVAKNPNRLAAVTNYQLLVTNLYGPYTGVLSNKRGDLKLRNAEGDLIDSVPYKDSFPWAGGADALGADVEWTKINPLLYQYRGRSLERVSVTAPSRDPANWLGSPIPGNPTPGKRNSVVKALPAPVVSFLWVSQGTNRDPIIRPAAQAKVELAFTSTNGLGLVRLEYFVDRADSTNESKLLLSMARSETGVEPRYTALIPAQVGRTVVRYRIRANRGAGEEVVSPRKDDPFGWHSYFVTPTRTSTRPIYDLFISTASLSRLVTNINQGPRRITDPNPPGNPRPSWNATVPAVFVADGEVYDVEFRYHGSRYSRNPDRKSYKLKFPAYKPFGRLDSVFITDKNDQTVAGHGIFRAADLPTSQTRYIDWYINGDSMITRLEQEEYDGVMLERAISDLQLRYPDREILEVPGETYKSVGTLEINGEGPYGRGDERLLGAIGNFWKPIQRYEWTYSLQNHGWKGHSNFQFMLEGLWTARGDVASATDINPPAPNSAPNIPQLRAYLAQHWDVDATLQYLAVIQWLSPWDDTSQNHFVWTRGNGKWGMLPWDMDNLFGGFSGNNNSIYSGEVGDSANNTRGANYLKDSWFKAYREEFKQKLFTLNNTLLHPDNITAMGYGQFRAYAEARFTNVQVQLALGDYQRPLKPTHISPLPEGSAFTPEALTVSSYSHTTNPAPAHLKTIWTIRHERGSYLTPVFRIESTNQLTQLPIPIQSLQLGERYFWRCEFVDAIGHVSFPSIETPFRFAAASPARPTVSSVGMDAVWKFDQSGTDRGTAWREPAFDDTAWASGTPIFGFVAPSYPNPIRTMLLPGRSTYYFRTSFRHDYSIEGIDLSLRVLVDDGAVFYLNGQEVSRIRMPQGPVNYSTPASTSVGDATYETLTIPSSALRQGVNVLAVEVHAASQGLEFPDVVFAASCTTQLRQIYLSEVLAINRSAVTHEGAYPDYIELFNAGNRAVDLAGMSLTDDLKNPERFIFPTNTLINPGGVLVVWCDQATNAPGLHTGFGLKAEGQTVGLFDQHPMGRVLRDAIQFGPQVEDLSIGRTDPVAGSWQLSLPSAGSPNLSAPTGTNSLLRINEWFAPKSGTGWVELFNTSTQAVALASIAITDDLKDPSRDPFPPLSFIGPRAFLLLDADGSESSALHTSFGLSASGDELGLFNSTGQLIDSVQFGPRFAGIAQGRLPDGADTLALFPQTSSPGESNFLILTNVIINEVLSQSNPPQQDSIEIHNLTDAPVNIANWFLSDDGVVPLKFKIPSNTPAIPARGFYVVNESQFNSTNNPNARIPFALSSMGGDQVRLSAALANGNLTGYRAAVDLGASDAGVSFGAVRTSQGIDFVAMESITLGFTNSAPRVGPVVIHEVMYHPKGVGPNDPEDSQLEYLELQNISTETVSLFGLGASNPGWRLRGGVDFNFPTNTTLPPNGSLVLVSFDPSSNAPLTKFRQVYGVSPNVTILGPFSGRLNNGGEPLELLKPGNAGESGTPWIVVERFEYDDVAPWPTEADGSGKALRRKSAGLYANEPLNWLAVNPNPGFDGVPDGDGDGLPDDYEQANGLDFTKNDASEDLDGDGSSNFSEFLAGTDPQLSGSVLRIHTISLGQDMVTLRWSAVGGKRYAVQRATSLPPGIWEQVGVTETVERDGAIEVQVALPNEALSYYRLRLVL